MAEDQSSQLPKKTNTGRKLRFGLNALLLIAVILVIILFVRTEQRRRETARQLEQTQAQLHEIQNSTQQNDEVSRQVLEKVRTLMDIPQEPAPTVARITDIDRLKEANAFFNVAQNEDYLILTAKHAIIYDPDRNIILDVAPFQVRQATASPGTSPQATPSP